MTVIAVEQCAGDRSSVSLMVAVSQPTARRPTMRTHREPPDQRLALQIPHLDHHVRAAGHQIPRPSAEADAPDLWDLGSARIGGAYGA